jgi:hypothetical protein
MYYVLRPFVVPLFGLMSRGLWHILTAIAVRERCCGIVMEGLSSNLGVRPRFPSWPAALLAIFGVRAV